MILCSSWRAMRNTSAGIWNRRQQSAMTQCLHCWWLLHLLFQRRLYRTWNRKNMKTTKISSYSYYQSTQPVGNKNHNTASSWSNCCALIVAQFGPHSWWQDICGVKTRFSLKHQCGNRFCLHKRVNWRTGKNSKTLWERPFPGDTRWLREGTESLTPAEYPWDNDYNRTWLQCRGLIQDYTAGRVRNITNQNTPKVRCNKDVTRT